MHDRLQSQLAQCEFAVTKSQLSSRMMASELENYEQLSHVIEKGINSAKLHIESSKAELKHAKTIRKNRMEYDVLAKVINEQPDRKQTEEKLKKLKRELSHLEESKEQLEKKLELRRKQFHVLISSIQQLQSLLEENDSDDSMISLDDEDMDLSKTK